MFHYNFVKNHLREVDFVPSKKTHKLSTIDANKAKGRISKRVLQENKVG